nr:binding partner of ACD11 1-like isoform X2 [Ipomoea batatas]
MKSASEQQSFPRSTGAVLEAVDVLTKRRSDVFLGMITGSSLSVPPAAAGVDNKPGDDCPPTWTINVNEVRTLKVSNISVSASEDDIKEFFSYPGDLHFIEVQRESDTTQLAYVTYKDPKGAETAMLLSGTQPESDSDAVKKAEDVVSSMLAKGFTLGKDAVNKAKSLDESYHVTSNASATVASVDLKMGISEKLSIGTAVVNERVKEMDQKYQVTEKAKSALAAAEQKGSAIMSNPYVSTGASWVSNAYNAVAKAAEDVSTMTKEKVEKTEEERRAAIGNDSEAALLDQSLAGDPAPNYSTDSKKLIVILGSGMTLKIQAIEIVNENLNVIFHQDRYLDLEIVSNESPCFELQLQLAVPSESSRTRLHTRALRQLHLNVLPLNHTLFALHTCTRRLARNQSRPLDEQRTENRREVSPNSARKLRSQMPLHGKVKLLLRRRQRINLSHRSSKLLPLHCSLSDEVWFEEESMK